MYILCKNRKRRQRLEFPLKRAIICLLLMRHEKYSSMLTALISASVGWEREEVSWILPKQMQLSELSPIRSIVMCDLRAEPDWGVNYHIASAVSHVRSEA